MLSSLTLDTQTGAGLGTIVALLSDGSAVVSGQSTTSIHPTLDQYNALLASVISLQTQVAALSFSLSQTQANQLQVRDPQGVYQPCSKLSFDSGSISTIHTSGTASHHAWVGAVSPPLDPP